VFGAVFVRYVVVQNSPCAPSATAVRNFLIRPVFEELTAIVIARLDRLGIGGHTAQAVHSDCTDDAPARHRLVVVATVLYRQLFTDGKLAARVLCFGLCLVFVCHFPLFSVRQPEAKIIFTAAIVLFVTRSLW